MSTLSFRRPDLTATQRRGTFLAVVGFVSLAAFPILLLGEIYHWRGGVGWLIFASTYGACILVWGVFVLTTGKPRPLTPTRTLWIPILLTPIFVAVDFHTVARLANWWSVSQPWISGLDLGFFVSSFPQLGYIGGSTYAVLGAAVRVRRWRAVLSAIGLILFVVWLLYQQTYSDQPWLAVTLVGIVPFVIGYRATAPSKE